MDVGGEFNVNDTDNDQTGSELKIPLTHPYQLFAKHKIVLTLVQFNARPYSNYAEIVVITSKMLKGMQITSSPRHMIRINWLTVYAIF